MKDCIKNPNQQVPLSNIKRIFRSQFQIELSETSLGHSKLSELLQDDKLHDICTVRLLEQGYFVIPTFESSDCQSDGQGTESTAFSWADADESTLTTDNDEPDFCATPYWLEEESSSGRVQLEVDSEPRSTQWYSLSPRAQSGFVHNTFIHAPVAPLALNRPRSQSVPRSIGRPILDLSSPASLVSPVIDMPATPELWAGLPSTTLVLDPALHSVPEAQALDAHADKFSWIQAEPFSAHLQSEVYLQEFAPCPFIQDDDLVDASAVESYSAKSVPGSHVMGSLFGCVLDDMEDSEHQYELLMSSNCMASPSPRWDHEHELPLLAALHSHYESVVSLRLAEHV